MKHRRRISSAQVILLSFLAVILLGAGLLTLPAASQTGDRCSFLDALFTATSATCVTGLVVFDTATHWSSFGQGVLLALIQLGGMGVVTVAALLVTLTGKKIGLSQRSTLQQSISAPRLDGLIGSVRTIGKTVLLFELLGAALLLPSFCQSFGWRGVWLAFFHSISAFCNAGFDLMGTQGAFSSLTGWSDSTAVNIVIMLLIVIGGIGFTTWHDIRTHGLKFRRYSVQSKLILTATAVLILLPAAWFFFAELSALPFKARLLGSLFQSVTLRTAGFNTVDLAAFSESGKLIMIGMMLVGGAPGSTAGGMKITTVAVLAVAAVSVFRRRKQAAVFGRRIAAETILTATALLVLYLTFALVGAMAISTMEHLPLLDCLFETASAAATVGLTLGLTPMLGAASKAILIFLMFFGRIGGLTLVFAALTDDRNTASFPEESIAVG